MKLIRSIFLVMLFVGFKQINAQNNPDNKEFDENKIPKENSKSGAESKPFQLDENDPYMGRKAEFLHNLTVTELPADFPKYDKSYGLSYYNNIVDNYYGAHKDILKPRVRQKIDYMFPSGSTNSTKH